MQSPAHLQIAWVLLQSLRQQPLCLPEVRLLASSAILCGAAEDDPGQKGGRSCGLLGLALRTLSQAPRPLHRSRVPVEGCQLEQGAFQRCSLLRLQGSPTA